MSNKHIARRFFELYGEQHDVEGCTPLFKEDVVVVGAAGQWQPMDFNAYKQLGYVYLTGVPDLAVKVIQQIEEGDTVVTRVVWSGTHTGMLNNIPATGRAFHNEAVFIDRFIDGKIADRLEVSDNMAFAQQLGILPPMPPG